MGLIACLFKLGVLLKTGLEIAPFPKRKSQAGVRHSLLLENHASGKSFTTSTLTLVSFLSRIQKLASETAIYGISTIVGRLINFLLVPFYLHAFPQELYQIVILTFGAFAILNHFFQHGMEGAYLKYASGTENRKNVATTFSTASWSLLAISIVLSGLLILARAPISNLIEIGPEWSHFIYYAAGILTLDALSIVPFAELRLQNRPFYFALAKLVNILINVGLNLYLILSLQLGIESVFIANLIASGGTLLLMLPLYLKLLRGSFNTSLWKQLLLFGLPFIPSGISYAFVDRLNAIFLAKVDGTRVVEMYEQHLPARILFGDANPGNALATDYIVATFGAVFKLGVFMMLFAQMFRFAWQPFFLQHAEDEDAKPLFSRVFTLYTAASLLVLLAISFFIDEIVALPLPSGRTLIPEDYWFALYLVPVILLAYFFQGWYFNFTAGAYIEKKTSYFATCTFAGAVLALIINLFVVPTYGMIASAWASTLAYALMAGLLYYFVQKVYPIPYRWTEVLKLVALASGIFAAWYLNPNLQEWWIEGLMILGYLAGVFVFRIVPIGHLTSLVRSEK